MIIHFNASVGELRVLEVDVRAYTEDLNGTFLDFNVQREELRASVFEQRVLA